MTARIGEDDVIAITGNPILPGLPRPSPMGSENEPQCMNASIRFSCPKITLLQASGEFFTDVSDASGMSLLDVRQRHWARYSTNFNGLKVASEVTESPVASTKLSNEAASLTGYLLTTTGGGDQAAQAVGCGIVREGVISTTLGTSGVVFAHSDEYRVESKVGCMHSAMRFRVSGISWVWLSAAGSYQWFRNQLCGRRSTKKRDRP